MEQYQLSKLRSDTNLAISAIRKSGIKGAINWGDLSCVEAAWIVNDEGDSYLQVSIEEVSPEAEEFREAIRNELRKAGWEQYTLRIVLEW